MKKRISVFILWIAWIVFETHFSFAAETTKNVVIITSSGYAQALEREIADYREILGRRGFKTFFLAEPWRSAEHIKYALRGLYERGLEGAIMIGDVPAALVRRGKGKPRPSALFFMDLNGEWSLASNKSYYDEIPEWPTLEPEIWVSYITAETLDGDPIEHMRTYLQKITSQPFSGTHPGTKALSFIDDEWAERGATTLGLEHLYGNRVVVVNTPEASTANRYTQELGKNYEWIHLISHNNRGFTGHRFAEGESVQDVDYETIRQIRPQALFYNFGGCSNCCFTKQNYACGWYLFGGSALAVLGTTMPGYMIKSDLFYERLSRGAYLGEAFKEWFSMEIPRDAKQTRRQWYLGVVLIGDPTISLMPNVKD